MAERDTEMIAWRGGALAFRTGDGMTATDPPLLLWEELAAEVSVLRKRAERAEAENARLREVLEWYEPRLSDCRKLGSIREGEEARADLSRDGGERARAALRPADAGEGVG